MRLDYLAGAISAAALGVFGAGAAYAGGLEANGYDWDLLFDPGTYAARASTSYVHVNHEISNTAYDPSGGTVASSLDRVYFNVGAKGDLFDNTSCLVSAQNPWGSGTERDTTYAAVTTQAARERLHSIDLGLTCAFGIELGAGVVSVIGGISAQQLRYEADIPTSPTTTTPLSIDGWGTGWRAGVAYEIEEYALRVSAIYNAAVDHNLNGSAFGGDATADVTAPQTVEIKAQTGIAPGWLAMASVKWIDWSIIETLDVDTLAGTISSDYFYRDGWAVSAGIGHQLTPDLTVLGRVTWDRGTSTPGDSDVLVAGSQTDRWGLTLGAAYDAAEGVQFSGGVSLSTLADGTNAAGESWDRGYVLAVSGGFKGTF
ncbi:OmpP1/FadL family transporter [Pelagibacterium xiamenense]|uniref:OmpP1/FadL family transporter n=1 Tax=Pelagibacterium xiamenense TaxID=2901140 RepID=UPI001E2A652A|nr:outer membrane protein transport protein [Pelagibacterium xiamenense]MCD7059986.1 outer membrane protein transport protein [Pelagibacterium xiamenense]